jgi:hypothetical protein
MGTRLFAPLLGPHPPDPDFGPNVDPETLVWPTRFLIIEETPDGYFLYEFDRRGQFVGDDWSIDVEEAKSQAAGAYGDRLGGWEDIPPEIKDYAAFGLARLSQK